MDNLIATKLLLPPKRPGLVIRQRLFDQLNPYLYPGCKLILISAPAGYGKTTLVTEWLDNLAEDTKSEDHIKNNKVWISLDEGDNDPARFISYFNAALNEIEGIESGFGEDAMGLLQSPQPLPPKATLTFLINKITSFPEKIILVLDDYHLIENQSIHDALGFFLENMPTQMHLVIVTREDPDLPLSRFRTRGQMAELRAADLRFSASETVEYLNRVMGLDLSSNEIASLETRTEGWIAGLQLAALSMRGYKDSSGLIKAFTGSHRLVQDFLIDEVLSQQSESIQEFLLKTSVLDLLTGSICDALTQRNNSQTTLESLERANLFIISQDSERHSFRYHHLFADLLRLRLQQTQPEQLFQLHRLASTWYEQNGFVDEAVTHALHADDFERAVNLIEHHIDTIWAQGEYTKCQRWLKGLPDELVLSRPQLCIFRAWELYSNGQPEAGEKLLQAAELTYDPTYEQTPDAKTQRNDQQAGPTAGRVRGRAEALLAWMAAWRRDDISGLIHQLQQALEYLPDQDLHWRGAVLITLADAHAFRGDLLSAYQARLEASINCEAAGNIYLFIYNSAKLALNLQTRGELLQTEQLCEQRVKFASANGMGQTAVVGWLLAIWGEVLSEKNNLDEALELVEKSIKLTERGGDVAIYGWSCLALTRVLFSRGDLIGAEEIVQKLEKVAQKSTTPTWIMYQNLAWKSRIWLAQDKLDAAAQLTREGGLDPEGTSVYMDGFKYLAMARILIALRQEEETTQNLNVMLESSEKGGNLTRVIKILILQALAFQAGGDSNHAVEALGRACSLAEPKGFFRIFVNEGQPLAHLLYTALDRGISPVYVNRLLQAFPLDKTESDHQSQSQALLADRLEALSEREIEVLELIAEGLTNPEISARLILSLHTVKTHARNIFSKLGVKTRTQAVSKGRALGILP